MGVMMCSGNTTTREAPYCRMADALQLDLVLLEQKGCPPNRHPLLWSVLWRDQFLHHVQQPHIAKMWELARPLELCEFHTTCHDAASLILVLPSAVCNGTHGESRCTNVERVNGPKGNVSGELVKAYA
jgi:hypothetical protein